MKSHAVIKSSLFCLPSRSQCSNTQLQSLSVRWLQARECFLSYKTVVRPSYKVVYRTVTSLEWKCCPGFSGPACEEGESKHAHKTRIWRTERQVGPFRGGRRHQSKTSVSCLFFCFCLSSASVYPSLPPVKLPHLSAPALLLLIRSFHRNTLKAGVASIRLT